MFFFDSFGWIGTILITLCGIPMFWKAHSEGHARGYSIWYLLMLWVGLICMLIFSLGKFKGIIIVLNFAANLAAVSGVLYYKLRPRKEDDGEGSAEAVDNPA